MGEILKAAGCDYTNGEAPSGQLTVLQPVYFLNPSVFLLVVKTTVLLADINDFNSVNDVYKTCELHRRFHTNRKWWSPLHKQPLGAHSQSPN